MHGCERLHFIKQYINEKEQLMRIALVHYWLVNMRGGEKVLESLCSLYPSADIYTHVVDRKRISKSLNKHHIHTTFINKLPFARTKYQIYLPFMPLALEQLDLRKYDLVISSESGPAKGVLTSAKTPHICYCHSPMRYLWDFYQDYLEECSSLKRIMFRYVAHKLRMWDLASASRVDHFIANSNNVAARIRKHYRREAEIIYPPIDVDFFTPQTQEKILTGQQKTYIMIGQLVRYKATHIAVEAFNSSGKKLLIIGEGSEEQSLRRIAKDNIQFLGRVDDATLKKTLAQARALIFPGEEDFGIVPLEAMAAGIPIIAYGQGGVLETVQENKSGLFFQEQTAQSLNAAVEAFERQESQFSAHTIQKSVQHFSRTIFEKKMRASIETFLARWDKTLWNKMSHPHTISSTYDVKK